MTVEHHDLVMNKSRVEAFRAISAASHPLAASAAATVYAQGGNAFDAAVATSFALAVVEPQSSGIAGQAMIMIRDGKSGRVEAVDAYSIAPARAASDMFHWEPSDTQGDYRFQTQANANTVGHLAAAVPGALLGWCDIHRRFARLPLGVDLQPAITLARDGFAIDARLARAITEQSNKLERYPASASIWFEKGGQTRRAGSIVVQTELARTLDILAEEGPECFYRGAIAKAIAEEVAHAGGILSLDDLAYALEHLLNVTAPVQGSVRGWTVHGMPLPSSGGTAVILSLQLFERLVKAVDAQSPVLMVELLRTAFEARTRVCGQPNAAASDIASLLSDGNCEALASEVYQRLQQPGNPMPAFDSPSLTRDNNTTHHTHIDSEGNCVACTQSIGDPFGSGVTVPGHGILLNNAMKLFDPRPDRPNGIAPYRKMLSSMAPTILERDSGDLIGLGSPSGTRIISAVVQTLTHRIWRNDDLESAVSRPRIHVSGETVEVESNLGETALKQLRDHGYPVKVMPAWDDWFGAVQAVDSSNNVFVGVADPRRHGAVVEFGAKRAVTESI